MTPAEIGRLLAGMPDLVWLDLTGGEPFSRRDCLEVIGEVLANTPSLAVLHYPTNGWFTDRVVAATELVRAQRPEVELLITVSLDGPQELHDRMRGRDGAFQKALETWRALREIPGVSVYLGSTLGPENRDAMEALRAELEAQLEDFDDSCWHWNRVQVSEHFFGNAGRLPAESTAAESSVDPDDAARVRRQLFRRWPFRSAVDWMEAAFLVNLQATLDGEPLDLTCQALHASCFVSPEGQLYPCHIWDRPLADLREHDFDVAAIWDDTEVLAARKGAIEQRCGGCFTPCEAYPTLAGSPLRSLWKTARRSTQLLRNRI
jgi:MoaA/NifB/PqqE/SkfB family radical SAM enzyme